MKMPTRTGLWTRRSFSGALTASMLSLGRIYGIFGMTIGLSSAASSRFAYVASSCPGAEGIHVYDISGSAWRSVQTVPAASPAHLERHPSLPVLYAVHCVACWECSPRGAVSAYAIDAISGRLTLLGSQPLSLSATLPRHAVVTADGSHLIVSAEGGGIYNMLPISEDGALQPPTGIRKEVGCGRGLPGATAKPHQLIRHPNGITILAVDRGTRTIGNFAVEGASLRHQSRMYPSEAVSQIAISANGQWVYASCVEEGSVHLFRFDTETKDLSTVSRRFSVSPFGPVLMAMHPSGRFLATAETTGDRPRITIWRMDEYTGHLWTESFLEQDEPSSLIAFSGDGHALLTAGSKSGRIVQTEINGTAHEPSVQRTLASVDAVTSLLFLQM